VHSYGRSGGGGNYVCQTTLAFAHAIFHKANVKSWSSKKIPPQFTPTNLDRRLKWTQIHPNKSLALLWSIIVLHCSKKTIVLHDVLLVVRVSSYKNVPILKLACHGFSYVVQHWDTKMLHMACFSFSIIGLCNGTLECLNFPPTFSLVKHQLQPTLWIVPGSSCWDRSSLVVTNSPYVIRRLLFF